VPAAVCRWGVGPRCPGVGRCLSWVESVGPDLEPGTVRVYIINGAQNGLTIVKKNGPCPGTGDGECTVVLKPLCEPFIM